MIIDDLTVFIVSTGEDTDRECLDALRNQECEFNIMHVRDVYPMSRAFQTMPDICPTRYFVQVDADMILSPSAISQLYAKILRTGFWVYQVHGQLYEDGYGIRGAVKCWKREIFKYFKFHDVRTVDRDFNRRVERWGLRKKALHTEPLGWHKPRHSDFSQYLKSKSDVEKWRFLGRQVEQYALDLLGVSITEFPASGLQFLGTLLGSMTGMNRVARSKDIFYEKNVFNDILRILNQNTELKGINSELGLKTEKIKALFSLCYASNQNEIQPFIFDTAKEIVEIFSRNPSDESSIQKLVEIVRQ